MFQYPDQRKSALTCCKTPRLDIAQNTLQQCWWSECHAPSACNMYTTRKYDRRCFFSQEVRVAHHSAVVFVSSLYATVAPKKIKEVMTRKTGEESRANIDTFFMLKKCANTHPTEDFWWCCDFF